MTIIIHSLSFLLFAIGLFTLCETEKIRYVSTEHPVVKYYNTKYFSNINMTSRRYGRKDPFYYVNLNFNTKISFGNNISINFYFYEFMTHRYERGFVELHFKLCDMMKDDLLFGASLIQGGLTGPCPYPPGPYNLSNMTMPAKHIPRNFPFKKGRIICNISLTATSEVITSAYIDMEIKEWRIKD